MGEIKQVALSDLDLRFQSLRLSSPAMEAQVRVSLEEYGMRTPVAVALGVDADLLVLVDGFKRVRVVKELGWTELPAHFLDLDIAGAHAAMLACNRGQRGLSELEEGWIVRSLCRDRGLTQMEVGLRLSRHKSWVCRRLKLVEHLDEAIQGDIRLGLLSATVGRELSRLPRGNQVPASQSLQLHGLSSRQTGKLVTRLLRTDDESACRELLADPLSYLSTEEGEHDPPEDPRLSKGGNELRRCLLLLESKRNRLLLACGHHAPAGLVDEESRVLLPLLEKAVEQEMHMSRRLKSLIERSGGQDERRTETSRLRGAAATSTG
ncbi:MAG: ParB N-terminal domain-containing protein [Lentisphaeria bacterium]|nr:ParB N-terminal domain-containing protein [Lentisphaeria bacterium]